MSCRAVVRNITLNGTKLLYKQTGQEVGEWLIWNSLNWLDSWAEDLVLIGTRAWLCVSRIGWLFFFPFLLFISVFCTGKWVPVFSESDSSIQCNLNNCAPEIQTFPQISLVEYSGVITFPLFPLPLILPLLQLSHQLPAVLFKDSLPTVCVTDRQQESHTPALVILHENAVVHYVASLWLFPLQCLRLLW